jgi:hypothetical protein
MRLKSPTDTPISFGTMSGSGHSMVLGPEGADVPQMLVQPAFAAGAVPFDCDPIAFVAAPVQTLEKDNFQLVQEGIKTMLERNEEGDFTASGLPDRRKLAKLVGLNVTAEELTKAWRALNDAL